MEKVRLGRTNLIVTKLGWGGIPIQRGGLRVLGLAWVKDLIEKAQNCSECGDCLPRCPHHLPIPDLIKENLDWVERL